MPEKDYWEKKFEAQENDPKYQELLKQMKDGTIGIPDSVVDIVAELVRDHREKDK